MIYRNAIVWFLAVVFLSWSPVYLFGAELDDFDGSQLNPNVWTIVDPLAGSDVSVSGGFLTIQVPAPVSHDVWISGNRAPRVMQPVADTDFWIEAKFDSIPSKKYQIQGLLVEQDVGNFLRFDIFSTV